MAAKKCKADLAALDTQGLLQEANAGNKTALSLLKQRYVEGDADFPIADMLLTLQEAHLDALKPRGGDRLAFKNAMRIMHKDILGKNPSSIEKLLAERVVVCWLDVQDRDLRLTNMRDCTIEQSAHASNQLTRAHNRLLSAIKTLATVRRLSLPIVQVNVADKQINTVGTGALDDLRRFECEGASEG